MSNTIKNLAGHVEKKLANVPDHTLRDWFEKSVATLNERIKIIYQTFGVCMSLFAVAIGMIVVGVKDVEPYKSVLLGVNVLASVSMVFLLSLIGFVLFGGRVVKDLEDELKRRNVVIQHERT